jgi:hypothetical protein
MNKHAIPQLVDYNFRNVDAYPVLRVRRIGDATDWRAVSFAIRNFIGAGVIIPDAALEDWVRDEMDMPGPDVATQRVQEMPQAPTGQPPGMPDIPTVDVPVKDPTTAPTPAVKPGAPQAPGLPKVGPPRQGPPTAKPTKSGSGRDNSGGK